MPIARDFSLDAKYRLRRGRRLPVRHPGARPAAARPAPRRSPARASTRRTMISGYRGSPLGGLDLTLERNQPMLAEHNVVFISGVNEDLGATVVYGSQLANYFPQPKYDGVLGMWYGKGPGVDRTGDIFKHANFAGIGQERRRAGPRRRRSAVEVLDAAHPLRGRASTTPSSPCSSRAASRRSWTWAAWASSCRATPACGSGSRSSPTSPTRSAPPRSRPAA